VRLRIRPLRAEEREAARRLINEAYLVERWLVDGDRLSEDEFRALESSGTFLAGVDDEGALRGCVFVKIDGERGYFGPLAVDPSAQQRGWGRQLVDAAESFARSHGSRAIELTIINLRTELPPFYRKLGYLESGSLPMDDPRKKQPCHFVVMRKPL
jgi:GNAT superfamily N-acetyltransferase